MWSILPAEPTAFNVVFDAKISVLPAMYQSQKGTPPTVCRPPAYNLQGFRRATGLFFPVFAPDNLITGSIPALCIFV
jgi:hypothetical protein